MSEARDADDQPPLRPIVFALLLTLSEGDLHGYAIMKRVNGRLGHRAIVGPGTLYRTLKELRETGWITHTDGPEEEDARRRYYTLTQAGHGVACGEAARMAELVGLSRASGLLPGESVAS